MPIKTKSFSEIASITRASNAAYFDSAGKLKTVNTNTSRFDYNPSTLALRGLLVEEQRTNLSSGSEYFETWVALNSPIRKRYTGVAPNGATNATEITATAVGEGIYRVISSTSGTKYTLSVFMKNVSGASSIRFGCETSPTNGHVTVNLVTGVISSSAAGVIRSSIQSLPNEWYRISVTFSSTSTDSSIVISNRSGSTAKWFIWGSQIEAGEFPTSYIHAPSTSSLRASEGTYFDSAGVLQTASIDVVRQMYNPSDLSAPPFLLIEEERTNSIRNNTMTGAAAGVPGTLPTTWSAGASSSELRRYIVGTGTEKGIPYIDVIIFGLVTSSRTYDIYFGATNSVAVTNGQTWTLSSFVKLSGGSFNISSIKLLSDIYTSGSAYSSTLIDYTITPNNNDLNVQRYSATGTISDASAAYALPFIRITTGSSGYIYSTLRIGLPQFELGSYVTSPIQTTSAAVTRSADSVGASQATRSADIASINVLDWYNKNEGTIYAEVSVPEPAAYSGFVYVAGTFNDGISYFRQSDFQPVNMVRISSSDQFVNGFGATWTTTAVFKNAQAYKTNDFAGSVNGGTVATDASGTIPTVSALQLGGLGSGSSPLNGHIRRISYYPRRLTNTELQALTT